MVYGTIAGAVWRWNGSTYDDYTLTVQRLGGDDNEGLSSTSDYLYIGFDRRFDAAMFWLSTTGSYSSLTWEVSTATGWNAFVPVQEMDYTFHRGIDYVRWDLANLAFEEWAKVALSSSTHSTVAPPDTKTRFWVRASTSDNGPTVAQIEAMTIRPYTNMATPRNVQQQLQFTENFDDESLPSYSTIEEYIRGAEDSLYYIMGDYYRPEFVEEELVNFKPYGMALRYRPILDVYELEVYTGNGWETKDEGRRGDWHYDAHNGMIYTSSILIGAFPPLLRRGYSERRNQTAFKRNIRVRYVHGGLGRNDRLGVQVSRIVTKQAAMDVIADLDFATLIPQGLDRITLQQKADIWAKEIEAFQDKYAKLIMF